MKIRFELPGGALLEYEREPMGSERFGAICIMVGIGMFFGLVALMIIV